jgi:hypothetical protein
LEKGGRVKLRKLSLEGIRAFSDYLDVLDTEPMRAVPLNVLSDPRTSESLAKTVEVERKAFANRFAAAEYLYERVSRAGVVDVNRDVGLWAWLTLFYFDEVCPPQRSGARFPGERARYIPDVSNFRKYYRHLLASPYRIYKAHRDAPERSLVVLSGALDTPGELAEQLSAYQEIVTNRAVMELATKMYIDPSSRKPRRGAAGKGAGSARRFPVVLDQFDLTWDLYATSPNELTMILPEEFTRLLAE